MGFLSVKTHFALANPLRLVTSFLTFLDELEFTMTQRFSVRHRWALVAAVSACFFSAAHAQPAADALYQRATAATCANCHGTEGRTTEGSAIPALAGMPKEYMVLQMKAFKEGTRPATVMHQITKGLTDAQVDSIATYYASLKR
jgi:sulfide dehydrogenase cytochrome subunit